MTTNEERPKPTPSKPKPAPPKPPSLPPHKPVDPKDNVIKTPMPNPRPLQPVKKFVRKEHLTDQPLKGHDGLKALAKDLEKTSVKVPSPAVQAKALKAKGYSNADIAKELNLAESSVRFILKPQSRTNKEKK